MTFELRLAIVALIAFGCASLATALIIQLTWRHVGVRFEDRRAAALRRVRLLPTLAGVSAAAWSAASFLAFEPRGDHETFGLVVSALAIATAALVAVSAALGLRALGLSKTAWRDWLAGATPVTLGGFPYPAYTVDTPFPIVAVVGLRRPALIIARTVLDACPPEELRAIVAHEHGHVTRRDNRTRLWFAFLHDLLRLMPGGRALEAAWHDAAEDDADDCAASIGPDGRLLLAQALIRVARLVPAGLPAAPIPACALYRGENIERRVRRLLEPPPARADRLRPGRVAAIGAIVIGSGLVLLQTVHEFVEMTVSALP